MSEGAPRQKISSKTLHNAQLHSAPVFLICVFWRGIGEEEEGESYKPKGNANRHYWSFSVSRAPRLFPGPRSQAC
ncbi:hypothetical protein R3I94_004589 [Phoxinus phoxinus]